MLLGKDTEGSRCGSRNGEGSSAEEGEAMEEESDEENPDELPSQDLGCICSLFSVAEMLLTDLYACSC
jgi:hypothetical protein